ncbi:MAG: T9SS type A sorting domain-containing protein, partial [Candidatus Cloacimonetes bacterium]|nr:T9SS type A sorting domain-containing protein [Candidatus Cloacimonadota bacterium]
GVRESKIEIYNIKGQLVDQLSIDDNQTSVEWDASKFSNGIYFYKLEIDNNRQIKKMILMR